MPQIAQTVEIDGEPYWETHPSKPLPAEVMENAQKWNAWATAVGGCSWNLDHASRWELKKYLFAQPGAHKIVYKPKTSGYVAGHGVWLGRGFCFDAQGFAKPVDDERGTVDLECADGAIRSFSIPPIAPRFSPSEEPMTTPLRYGIPRPSSSMRRRFPSCCSMTKGMAPSIPERTFRLAPTMHPAR